MIRVMLITRGRTTRILPGAMGHSGIIKIKITTTPKMIILLAVTQVDGLDAGTGTGVDAC